MTIRPLQDRDLDALRPLWNAEPWSSRTDELQRLAAEAARAAKPEHRALCATDDSGSLRGVILFRMVAGAVGTGEIEAVAANDRASAQALLEAAVQQLRDSGARIIVAEHPGSPQWQEHARLLAEAGFTLRASVGDYYAAGVPLQITVRSASAWNGGARLPGRVSTDMPAEGS